MRRFLVFGALSVLAGCLSTTPTPSQPSLPPIPGPAPTVYTGAISDSVNGAGSVTISVNTVDSVAGGTWSATYPGQQSVTRFISGTLNGTGLTATVSDCPETDTGTTGSGCFPNCRQTVTGTMTASNITGNYAEVPGDHCAAAHSGSVTASRQ